MIREFSFHNYKAFIDGNIQIKPITLLLGANSVGKSSISQLLLMLKQTASEVNEYDENALKLNGQNVSLGENINLLRNKDATNTLSFSFTFGAEVKEHIVSKLTGMFFRCIERFALYTGKGKFLDYQKQFNTLKADKKMFVSYLKDLKSILEKKNFDIWKDELSPLFNQQDEFVKAYDFLGSLEKTTLGDKTIEVRFEYRLVGNKEKKISTYVVSRVLLSCDNINIIDLFIDSTGDRKEFVLCSDLYKDGANFCDDNYRNQLERLFSNIPCNMFNLFSRKDVDLDYSAWDNAKDVSVFLKLLYLLLQNAQLYLKKSFSESTINYVSPLRAYPKRYYFLDRGHVSSSLDTLNGDSITEILKDQKYIRQLVNAWLKHFKLEINVEAVEEIIHKLKVSQNGLNLDITDVGFGISQLLPVIVQGFYTPMDSLTIIEQPEVHLHPRMQADLGDLFIDIVFPHLESRVHEPSKYLLIETHSEYLLKRIRRRIATGMISSNDVAIYMVKSQVSPRCSTLTRVNIDEFGAFDWPEEFYGGELLKDTLEFLRIQATKKE